MKDAVRETVILSPNVQQLEFASSRDIWLPSCPAFLRSIVATTIAITVSELPPLHHRKLSFQRVALVGRSNHANGPSRRFAAAPATASL
jgi:hypothetical protein